MSERSDSEKQQKKSQDDDSGRDGDNNGDGGGGNNGKEAVVVAATAAAAAVSEATEGESDNEELERKRKEADDQQIMILTRKMIEIRSILSQIDQADTLRLPSIVVVGSQSSGKSSVLEAIVGHEFLPKGSNMVTRRPIELTLINAPSAAASYGVFPALKSGKITDFYQIQKTLSDLNLAVSELECVSDDPIRLEIYSPTVPDLTLIDLPGYIQLAAADQPESLKSKISALCDKYIQEPNIILAISPADVDLANSTALRASRRVDPRGERTIGVVTKMDLVDPQTGVDILLNNRYPLRMGYVGLVCKPPASGLFRRHGDLISLTEKQEHEFFGRHPLYAETNCKTGLPYLRNQLMRTLEDTMARSLAPTATAIRGELEEASYQFKVEYNDRILTPETYLAESLDEFKIGFQKFSSAFGRQDIRDMLKSALDQKVLDILAEKYWSINSKASVSSGSNTAKAVLLDSLPSASQDDPFWNKRFDLSSSSLTKLGIGRLATMLTISSLMAAVEYQIDHSTFAKHPFARSTITDSAARILNDRYFSAADQVENCIKPFKYEIDLDEREWQSSRDRAYGLLKTEMSQCHQAYQSLRKQVGAKTLDNVMDYISKTNNSSERFDDVGGFGFSQALLAKGREGIFLKDRLAVLQMRLQAVKSKQCRSKKNKMYCPEIFLDAVADKLVHTAVLFLNVELLSDFYYNFPRELDQRLGRQLSIEQVEAFAREDPRIQAHLDLQNRKHLLELALEKMESVLALQRQRRNDI
ncbi:hypothetical protein CANCADRAFT_27617 [Tortispora caseinolytica NRRL Y-17796]|uniref:dynamin GTPase n=1 Tax=Tortispora caseinolytica NRRL Y-17796 TaxID=767744 RepID=A0A1E4TAT1_9ASCO|nr:hypothetical protein CANCADRAFT_27617 [Tortispora caseinolytica NRRL Y-17796]